MDLETYFNGCNTWLIVDRNTHNHTCTYNIPNTLPSQTMEWEAWARDRASNSALTVVGTLDSYKYTLIQLDQIYLTSVSLKILLSLLTAL